MSDVLCLFPAAGRATRMRGADKLLEEVDGAPCLVVMAGRALAAGMDVAITLPTADHPRTKAVARLPILPIIVPDAVLGMSQSLKAGAKQAISDDQHLMVLPPDMPALEQSDLEKVLAAFRAAPNQITQAITQDGKPGHPCIFPNYLLGEFDALNGDRGAAQIIRSRAADVTKVTLTGTRARGDLDTPEDWNAWRASQL